MKSRKYVSQVKLLGISIYTDAEKEAFFFSFAFMNYSFNVL